jgi:hypothetical protein
MYQSIDAIEIIIKMGDVTKEKFPFLYTYTIIEGIFSTMGNSLDRNGKAIKKRPNRINIAPKRK